MALPAGASSAVLAGASSAVLAGSSSAAGSASTSGGRVCGSASQRADWTWRSSLRSRALAFFATFLAYRRSRSLRVVSSVRRACVLTASISASRRRAYFS